MHIIWGIDPPKMSGGCYHLSQGPI